MGGGLEVAGRWMGGGQAVPGRWTGGPRAVDGGRLTDGNVGRVSSDLITAAPESHHMPKRSCIELRGRACPCRFIGVLGYDDYKGHFPSRS